MLTFEGKRARPGFTPTGKRANKASIRLPDCDTIAAIVIHNDDPLAVSGERLMELKFADNGLETKHWMLETDARALAHWILKNAKEVKK